MNKANRQLILDTFVFLLSLGVAIRFIIDGHLHDILQSTLAFPFLAEIISGFFFTSFLTTPLAMASFYILGELKNPFQLALVGGLGAVIGDMVIIKLFRDSVFKDFHTLSDDLKLQKLGHFFKDSHFNQLAPILGLIVIASPIPDEIGLALLGTSKLKYFQIIMLTYLMNVTGILSITLSSYYINK